MFYEQLLCTQIPKVQKDSQVDSLFVPLGSSHIKAAHRTYIKLTPGEGGIIFGKDIWKCNFLINLVRNKQEESKDYQCKQ